MTALNALLGSTAVLVITLIVGAAVGFCIAASIYEAEPKRRPQTTPPRVMRRG